MKLSSIPHAGMYVYSLQVLLLSTFDRPFSALFFYVLHPYCRSKRGIANKPTAQRRPIDSAHVALGVFKPIVAPNHGPHISAPFIFRSVLFLRERRGRRQPPSKPSP